MNRPGVKSYSMRRVLFDDEIHTEDEIAQHDAGLAGTERRHQDFHLAARVGGCAKITCYVHFMVKSRNKAAEPEVPPEPRVGDKVKPGRSVLTYEISNVHYGGKEVDLQVPGTNMQRFRERVDNLTFVERKPPARTSNPFTEPESVIDSGEVLERIATVKEENLQRLDDDVDILKAYLKTQRAPETAIEALEGLTVEQHVSWKKAVDRIKKLLDG
jgi:hypothetical protein